MILNPTCPAPMSGARRRLSRQGYISVVVRWLRICSCGWFSLSATRTSKAGACRASVSWAWGRSEVHARHSSNLLHILLACLAWLTTEYHTRTCGEPPRDYTHACPAVAHGRRWRCCSCYIYCVCFYCTALKKFNLPALFRLPPAKGKIRWP